MDRIATYRQIIKDLISRYAQLKPAHGDIDIKTLFDEANDHYQLFYLGWNDDDRIYGPVLHLNLQNGKVWIQQDGIEGGVAEELVDAGIPRENIVLAFHPLDVRPHTGYAIQ